MREISPEKPMGFNRYPDCCHFVLYSIGWNQKDAGGVERKDGKGHLDHTIGDWVLAYPR